MTRRFLAVMILWAALLAGAGVLAQPASPTAPSAQQPAAAAPDFSAVDAIAQSELDARHTPGAALAIVIGDRVVYAKGYGVTSIETKTPVTPDTLFRMGSTTKMFTAAAVVTLADQGKLALDAPIARVVTDLDPRVAAVTPHQLLSQSAGLRDFAAPIASHDDDALGRNVKGWREDVFFTEPGRIYSYSSPGYWLAGFVAEQAHGKPYADALHDLLFAPLGMRRTTLRPLVAATYPLAMGHQVADGKAAIIRPIFDNVAMWPGGSIFSTAEDLSRFAIAFMDGGRLQGAQALSPLVVSRLAGRYAPLPGADEVFYGYGVMLFPSRGVRVVSHGGASRGYGSTIDMVPERRAAVIVLANRSGETLPRTRAKAMEIALAATAPASPSTTTSAGTPEKAVPASADAASAGAASAGSASPGSRTFSAQEMADYAGIYSHAPQTWEIAVRDGGLVLIHDGATHPLEKVEERAAAYGPANARAHVVFAAGPDGRTDHLFMGLYAARKTPPSPSSAPRQPHPAPPSTAPDDLRQALDSIDAKAVRAHVEFLADDLLEGRDVGARGYDLAAKYVATQLALRGVKPAGDNGTFFQQVPLIESRLESAALSLRRADGKAQPLVFRDDFITTGNLLRTDATFEAPVVFTGFGVTAPELSHDDYAGLDVRGKIVAVLTNAPASFPSEQRAHYSSGQLKAETAAKNGARGILTLWTPGDERRTSWAKLIANPPSRSVAWVKPDGTPAGVAKEIAGGALVSLPGARKLFAGLPGRLDAIFKEAEKGAPRGVDLGVAASFAIRSTHTKLSSPNVVGLIEGSDPTLKDTSVVCSAHLDHIGIGNEVKGDRIYNGAYDNALGSAILIEAAGALASLTKRPARSIAFVFVTAEEKGLVGSDYFATTPTAAARRVVANVNVDMPLLLFPIDRVVAFGAEHSTLQGVTARAASLAGLTLIPDPIPEENLFIRSDQYSFVRQGIPAVFLVPGFTSSDPKIDGQKMFGEFLATHYHMPTDDLRLPVDVGSVERFARANVALAYLIASEREAPRWNAGDFFGTTFSRSK